MALLSIHRQFSLTKSNRYEAYHPLLLFLKNYTRVSSPSRSEIEQWFGTFPQQAFIDPLAEFRLPLTSTFFSNDIWTIIKPEVNLDTYKEWFKVVPILKEFLNKNDICTYAINNALPNEQSGGTVNTWEVHPKYNHIIGKVEECAENITDLERATAAVYTLMSKMAPGADKVAMAELSYKYARLYNESASGDDVQKAYNKVKQRYFNYSAIHILHKYQLAEDKYLKLVAQPTFLTSKLYEDPRIPKHICRICFDCPDINQAVDELCILFGISAKKVKLGVLLELLKSDSTLTLDREAENDCLIRACYICGSTDMYRPLLKIGMNKEETEGSISVRANALKCFYYTTDTVMRESLSEMANEEFLTYINKVSVMAKLVDFGLNLKTVDDLDHFNQKKLLRKLSEIDKPLAIQCVASICKIYELDDLKYWKFIINAAIRFNMVKDLRRYLEHVRFRCVSEFVEQGWDAIITDAFRTEVIQALKMIQTCPVVYALSFENYIKICISNQRLEIAAIMLQYISTEKHEAYIKVIISRKRIFEDVAELKQKGILGTDKVIDMLKLYYNK